MGIKSSFSQGNSNCLEASLVQIGDSKHYHVKLVETLFPDTALYFPPDQWEILLSRVRHDAHPISFRDGVWIDIIPGGIVQGSLQTKHANWQAFVEGVRHLEFEITTLYNRQKAAREERDERVAKTA